MSLLEKASLIVTPNAYKTSKLYSVVPNTTLGDMDVVRATTATRVNSSGLIESIGLNIPRIDYTNGSCPSILVEPQRTNLFLNSVFNGTGSTPTSWSLGFATGTSAPAVSTKSTIGQAYTFTTSASRQVINQSLNYVSGTTYSCSVYVENVTGTIPIPQVLFFNGTGTHTFYKDGVLISSSTAVVSGSRYTAIFAATATQTQQVRVGNGCTTNTTGSVRLSMPQLEAGSNATSYIPTIASTVTRNADVISKTGISSLIGQTEGVFYAEIVTNDDIISTQPISLNDGTTSNRILLYIDNSRLYTLVTTGGTPQASILSSTILKNTKYKLAIGYKSNDIVFYVNGVLIGTDTSATIPACSAFSSHNGAATSFYYSKLNSVQLYKTRLTNSELAQLTTI